MGLLYQKRRLKVNKIKRQIASNRILFLRIKMLVAFFMILGIAYLCYWSLRLPQWYINSEKLNHASSDVLKIYGNVITPDYKIINMVRQTQLPYTQIFRLDTTELENNISQLAPIKKVYVRRYWFPARLVINVEERVPAFLLSPNLQTEPIRALTTDGIIIDHDYLPLKIQFKAKKLLTYGVRDGYDEVWDKKKVDELLKLIKAFEAYSNQEIQYIDLRNQKDVYIMLQEYLVRMGEINETSLNRAKWIASILPEARKYKEKVKYIDLRWDDSYYLRLKDTKEEIKKEDIKKDGINKDEIEIKIKEEEKTKNNIQEEEKSKQPAAAAAKIEENKEIKEEIKTQKIEEKTEEKNQE